MPTPTERLAQLIQDFLTQDPAVKIAELYLGGL